MKATFLNEVNLIIEQNIDNESFGVNDLVNACNLSRSKLYRKFKEYTNKSTSQYIREFRLDKAHELLIKDDFTSAEIAYKVGFSSPTYFNSSFRRYFGYPPGEAKLRSALERDGNKIKKEKEISLSYRKWIVLASALITLAIAAYVILSRSNKSNQTILDSFKSENTFKSDISIAILPFKNLSDREDNAYLSFGIREELINKVSQIQQLVVKSPYSIEDYMEQYPSYKELGNNLGVDYLINGSVQKHNNKIKIIINLIETQNDQLKTSKSFEGSFNEIFDLEKEISKDIATELNLMITPEQLESMTKVSTYNTEAYKLYLKGRYFYYLGVEDSSKLAYQYFLECISLDPEFAMAYIGLADLIDLVYNPWIPEEKYDEMRGYALKVMSLDMTIADPHKTLAKIYMKRDHNWDAAEKEFQLALKIDPSHIESNIEYARFLAFVRGDFEGAQKLHDRVEKKDPLSLYNLVLSAEAFIAEGNYEHARIQIEKVKEMHISGIWPGWIYWNSFVLYLMENNEDKAIEELVKGWNYYPDGAQNNIEPLLKAYNENGIEGVFKWLISLNVNEVGPDSQDEYKNGVGIAEHYAFIGEQDKAIEMLQLALKYKNVELFKIKYRPLLNSLRNNPKFLEILKQLNLGDYNNETFLD